MSNLIKQENNQVVPSQPDPMMMVQTAIEKGMDVEALTRLMDLQERWEANTAKKEYFQAFNHFQSILPTIKKTKEGYGYKYAPLGDIAEQIKPMLKECDLSYRFEQDHSDGIKVTCIVNHVSGHSERTTMRGQPDHSGKKNEVQAISSTVTYLQRYTLTSALGITTADEDIDGRLATQNGNFLSGEQVSEIESLLVESGANRERFMQHFGINQVDQLPETSFAQARAMLKRKVSK